MARSTTKAAEPVPFAASIAIERRAPKPAALERPIARECDLVMRGGITSGVVYPALAARLSDRFVFRSIGGTSAGAIAAAATAAAQYGVNTGSNPEAFLGLAGVPDELSRRVGGGESVLASMFAPDPYTASLHRMALGAMQAKGVMGKFLAVLLSGRFLPYWLVGAVLGVFAGAAIAGIVGAVPIGFLGFVVGLGIALVFLLRNDIPEIAKNRFGLCSGMARPGKPMPDEFGRPIAGEETPALTEWIHLKVQTLAGRSASEALTFGDLWGAFPKAASGGATPSGKAIELVLMTTDVTRNISGRAPFLNRHGPLYMHRDDIDALFPGPVAEKLKARGSLAEARLAGGWRGDDPLDPPDEATFQQTLRLGDLSPEDIFLLPKPADLPIVFGARISMSFPLLLSAVPVFVLHAERWGAYRSDAELARCWLSDGGVTSNFPVHFFDSPLPTRPTFGVNLAPTTARVPFGETGPIIADPERRVWMPRKNDAGFAAVLFGRDRPASLGAVGAFLGAIVTTAREWNDNEQMLAPGVRDRVVHVFLDNASEGGLNLDMPREVIRALTKRGRLAADALIARYANDGHPDPIWSTPAGEIEMDWTNHRWTRFRGFMAAQELTDRRFAAGFGKGGYEALLSATLTIKDAPCYEWANKAHAGYAWTATKTRVAFVAAMTAESTAAHADFGGATSQSGKLSGRAPRPAMRLASRPAPDGDPKG